MPADLEALVALMPFAGHLGLVLDEAGPDRVVARPAWAPHLCTTGGVMHGGVLMSLADTVVADELCGREYCPAWRKPLPTVGWGAASGHSPG